ncbi:MAG: flagellar biosynthetic protein FliR [Verrucomicrobiota bacterium]
MHFEITNWMLVFTRISAMLAVFPIFSSSNVPVRLRIALGALVAVLVAPSVQGTVIGPQTGLFSVIGLMAQEVGIGLLFGFASRMLFYALDIAGGLISQEIGLNVAALFNPLNDGRADLPGMVLYYFAAVLFLSLDMHHWMLVGFQRSYEVLPMGTAHLGPALLADMVARTSRIFLVALQLAAPLIAVSFLITLIFAVLGRAVPQMNVFSESFAFRTLGGLAVFGLTLNLMAQHMLNYLRRLPEDFLRVAQLLAR